MSSKLKLTIELVPASSWNQNLRKILPKTTWDKIRKHVISSAGQACSICKIKARLQCHEVWRYDDVGHTQRLLGFQALCRLCHLTKHLGFAGILASRGKLDYEQIIRHFTKINKCDRGTFIKHQKEAYSKWLERSKYDWSVDLGSLISQ